MEPERDLTARQRRYFQNLEDDLSSGASPPGRWRRLKRRMEIAAAPKLAKPRREKTSKEIVLDKLYDRGDEVLEAAYSYYPSETAMVVDQLAGYLKSHPETEKISGGELSGYSGSWV